MSLQTEIAMIAATLARSTNDSPSRLVSRALELYHAAGAAIAPPAPSPSPPCPQSDPEPKIPSPKSYPVKFDDALRLWMPTLNGRTADRAARFRTYLTQAMHVAQWNRTGADGPLADTPVPAKATVDRLLAQKRRNGYNESTYPEAARDFLTWQARYVSAVHAETGRNSPQRRKLKKSV